MTKNERDTVNNIFKGLSKYRKTRNTISISEKETKYFVLDEKEKNKDAVMFLLYSKLSNKEKRYIDLYFREGLSISEVAQKMYVSESTYYRRMREIYQKVLIYIRGFEDLFKYRIKKEEDSKRKTNY